MDVCQGDSDILELPWEWTWDPIWGLRLSPPSALPHPSLGGSLWSSACVPCMLRWLHCLAVESRAFQAPVFPSLFLCLGILLHRGKPDQGG